MRPKAPDCVWGVHILVVKRAPFPRLSQARCASMRCVGSAMAIVTLAPDYRFFSNQNRFPVLLQSYLLLQLGLANDACIAVTFPCASASCLLSSTYSNRLPHCERIPLGPRTLCARQALWTKSKRRCWEKRRLDHHLGDRGAYGSVTSLRAEALNDARYHVRHDGQRSLRPNNDRGCGNWKHPTYRRNQSWSTEAAVYWYNHLSYSAILPEPTPNRMSAAPPERQL